ncbi:MAG TPA: methionine gamma-lyase [Kosmotogaceae bacterium]|nr:MAG: Cystathionine gamma-lyase [Thermotogales bacterium 46_20]HAA86097.1 methionine gamma-lyase [Kosmotogaceae bacterium]
MKELPFHIETLAIHGAEQSEQNQSLNPPIYMTSTFTFTDLQQADDTFSFKRKAYVYTRGGNPTVNLFEKRLAAIEGGEDSVAFSSGMAAISTVLMSLAKAGDEIVAHRNLYGSTFGLTSRLLPSFNLPTRYIDMTNLEEIEEALTKDTKVFFLETPTNPSMEIIDISAVAEIAHQHGIKVVVDNTFASPCFQRPLNHGADVVVHSATKYLSGHGDTLGGIATSKDEKYIADLKFGYMCELGGVMSPFNAWLILRGMKTLPLRMKMHESNAIAIARFLLGHHAVKRVIYPGLEDHPGHSIAAKQMTGYGGIVSFELHGGLDAARSFVEKLKLLKLAVSLGDTESLVEIPALMTHRDYPSSELEKFGFTESTVRISAGLEHPEDLLADMEQAL